MASNVTRNLSRVVQTALTTQAGAYAANQVVGGIQEIQNAVEDDSGVVTLLSANALDQAKQSALLWVVIFGKFPAGSYADAAAFNPSAADMKLIQTAIQITAASYMAAANSSIGSAGNLWQKIQRATEKQTRGSGSKSKSLWMVVVTGAAATPTYGAGNKLDILLGLNQD